MVKSSNKKELKTELIRFFNTGRDETEVTDQKRRELAGNLQEVTKTRTRRREFTNIFFGVTSTKDLSAVEVNRLLEWLDVKKIDGVWTIRKECYVIAIDLLGEPPKPESQGEVTHG